MSFHLFTGTDTYLVTPELRDAVNVACALEKPLLIRGEPGTGKTVLAEAIAENLGKQLLTWNIKSTTKAQDGLYVYDTVQRLNDARFGDRDISDIRQYIKYGPMGLALRAQERVVLLIDEIDKADIEFPNDLLHELDRMSFSVAETGDQIKAEHRPIVVITSNNEKELPDAFLRRCVFHYIEFPGKEIMTEIVRVHHPDVESELLRQVLLRFYWLRELPDVRKRPSTSELIDWIAALQRGGISAEVIEKELPFMGVLLKRENDIETVLANRRFGRVSYSLLRRLQPHNRIKTRMFVDFFYHLRQFGLKASSTEWLALMEALAGGHARADLNTFYHLARSLLVKRETEYDTYDRAFASFFAGIEATTDISQQLLEWLENPALPKISDADRAKMQAFDLDELSERFRKLLAEQKERHDGGSRWIGTGGTSPFGHGGENPAGVRVGGEGGSRSAVQVAGERRFRNLRSDQILDTRQIGVALRRLKRLAKDTGPEELQLDETIDESARNGGEIELVFGPPRRNRIKLLLLMDVGGSMDPYTRLCERLFSAAHAANHFKQFEHRFFHNCVYERLFTDMRIWKGEPTVELLKTLDHTWSAIFVGDAWMAPSELTHLGGAISLNHRNSNTGLSWLMRIRQRVPNSIWLNPEPRERWNAATIRIIRRVFPMYELSIDGLTEAVDVLRKRAPIGLQRVKSGLWQTEVTPGRPNPQIKV